MSWKNYKSQGRTIVGESNVPPRKKVIYTIPMSKTDIRKILVAFINKGITKWHTKLPINPDEDIEHLVGKIGSFSFSNKSIEKGALGFTTIRNTPKERIVTVDYFCNNL